MFFLTYYEILKIADEKQKTIKKCRAPGWLSQLTVQLLISAQVIISRVPEFEPCIRLCADSSQPTWDSTSLPLLRACVHSLAQKEEVWILIFPKVLHSLGNHCQIHISDSGANRTNSDLVKGFKDVERRGKKTKD